MSSLKLIRKMVSPLIFLNIASRYMGRSSMIKIKAAQAYVSGAQKIRILSLGILCALLSLILLGSGLFLVHTALFTYSVWSLQTKFIAALVLGGVEFTGAIIILFYLFREKMWVKFYGIQKVINSVGEGKFGNNEEK